jgi:hypothetical protein
MRFSTPLETFNEDSDHWKARSTLVFGLIFIFLFVFSVMIVASMVGLPTHFAIILRDGTTGYAAARTPCDKAELFIQRAYYDSESRELTLDLFNKGEILLEGFDAVITYQDGYETSDKFEALSIPDHEIKELTLSTDRTLKTVLVRSLECKNAQDLMSRNDIQGIGL